MNTRLVYSYTDGSNHRDTSVVVAGAITPEQREQIRVSLAPEEVGGGSRSGAGYFVPAQVGLPDGSMIGQGYQPTPMDGDMHELRAEEIETTMAGPTVPGDIATLTAAFAGQRGHWNWKTHYGAAQSARTQCRGRPTPPPPDQDGGVAHRGWRSPQGDAGTRPPRGRSRRFQRASPCLYPTTPGERAVALLIPSQVLER
jgi:hypothetical protein